MGSLSIRSLVHWDEEGAVEKILVSLCEEARAERTRTYEAV